VEIFWLTDEIGFCEQPTFHDLRELGRLHVRTLVDVRLPNERPASSAVAAERHGLRYVHVPIPAVKDLRPEDIDQLAKELRDPDTRPALVCSGEGARAATAALLCVAREAHKDWSWIERWATRLGLDLPLGMRAWIEGQPAAT
jgi:protein tyrosine phosphatase (PTP) superfamily phosphohydrolase (DUF442 family)